MAKTNETFLNALPHQEHTYFKTYFRINAGYEWGYGMPKEKTECFENEMKELFSKAGWSIEESRSSAGCPTFHKGGNQLYCHPMELSGPCESAVCAEVETLLKSAETCDFLCTDCYGIVYDVSDKQYAEAMSAARQDIENDLLAAYSTGRKDKYIRGYYAAVDNISEKFYVPTLTRPVGVISSTDVHVQYVKDVFQDLVKEGKILSVDTERGGKAYRALTGPERLEMARKEAISLASRIQDAQSRADSQAIPKSSPEIRREPPDVRCR